MNYIGFDPEKFTEKRTAVIDGDGFAWAIGWLSREAIFEKEVTDMVDNCIHDILQGTQSEHYIGILSPLPYKEELNSFTEEINPRVAAAPNFRKAIAKSRPYKGQRPEKPEWYLKWAPIIENHLEQVWGFIRTPEGYEADDLVATIMTELTQAGAKPICCGNDKDLHQIPGEHFNVVKKTMHTSDWYQCSYKLWLQVLTGDTTDNIEGIPGCGPKGAEKILSSITIQDHSEGNTYRLAVLRAYVDKFGEDLGIQKFYENYMLVKLRTDVPTEHLDLTEICRGYDLAKYEVQETPRNDEPDEAIPDFSITE